MAHDYYYNCMSQKCPLLRHNVRHIVWSANTPTGKCKQQCKPPFTWSAMQEYLLIGCKSSNQFLLNYTHPYQELIIKAHFTKFMSNQSEVCISEPTTHFTAGLVMPRTFPPSTALSCIPNKSLSGQHNVRKWCWPTDKASSSNTYDMLFSLGHFINNF